MNRSEKDKADLESLIRAHGDQVGRSLFKVSQVFETIFYFCLLIVIGVVFLTIVIILTLPH